MALTQEQKMEVALFRFGLIAPLLNNQVDDPKAYLEMLAPKVHDVPFYGKREYSIKTIRRTISTSLSGAGWRRIITAASIPLWACLRLISIFPR